MNQSPSQSWSGGVARILEMVSSRTGWEFPPTRWLYAETIIRQAMGKAKLNASLDFALMLERDRQALDALVEQLLIYETYFFRDRQHFDLIRDSWRREMDARWGDGHLLNLWSAGCVMAELYLGEVFLRVEHADYDDVIAAPHERDIRALDFR